MYENFHNNKQNINSSQNPIKIRGEVEVLFSLQNYQGRLFSPIPPVIDACILLLEPHNER